MLFITSSSLLKRKKEIRGLLVSTRKDKRGRHLRRKVIHPLRFWRESLPRSHRAREKELKCTKPRSLLSLKSDEMMMRSRTKRRTKLSKRTKSTSLSPPGKRMSFELKGRETYLSDLLRPTGEVKILPPFPGFVVRNRLRAFVDFGRRHRDRGESERILCPSSHRRHVRTHPTTDDGGSGAMIFSRRRGRSSSSRSK